MASNARIIKVSLTISDMNRGYYHDHTATIAQQASETDLRVLYRIVAFALNASESMQFTQGLAEIDEPDLWQMDLTGRIQHWIDLGQPTEKRIRQSCGKSNLVSIYTYQRGHINIWFEGMKDQLTRFQHLQVFQIHIADEAAASRMVTRALTLSCVIQDDQILLTTDTETVAVAVTVLKPAT